MSRPAIPTCIGISVGRASSRSPGRRAKILAATVDLPLDHGIARTTIEAAGRRSRAAKTTIYRQWPDQPTLVRDAFASRRGIERGEPAPDSRPADVLDLLTGPIFYRRWVSHGLLDTTFVTARSTVLH